jgi:pyruvate formate lyase activating enzyme
MKGLIFSFKRYAIHDGPGIRVTFFMKGCPLDCWWCHNPEGKESCQVSVERTDRVGDMEFKSTEVVGREYTPAEIVSLAARDRVFMEQSGGGVTFSGGEPLLQHAFLRETLSELKTAGYHTTVDTSGYAAPEKLRSVIPFTDLFLYDIKHLNPETHLKYTGVKNDVIISNLDMLLREGAEVWLRIPVIPGVTSGTAYMEELRKFIEARKPGKITMINLLPYHKTGSSKYRRFGLPDRMTAVTQVSDSRLEEYIEILNKTGIRVKKGG